MLCYLRSDLALALRKVGALALSLAYRRALERLRRSPYARSAAIWSATNQPEPMALPTEEPGLVK